MGIYTRRGIEYLFIFDSSTELNMVCIEDELRVYVKAKVYPLFNAIRVIDQNATDDRLLNTRYYKDHKSEWFLSNHDSIKNISSNLLFDFGMLPSEKEIIHNMIYYLTDRNISCKEHGWFDVTHVYSSL